MNPLKNATDHGMSYQDWFKTINKINKDLGCKYERICYISKCIVIDDIKIFVNSEAWNFTNRDWICKKSLVADR